MDALACRLSVCSVKPLFSFWNKGRPWILKVSTDAEDVVLVAKPKFVPKDLKLFVERLFSDFGREIEEIGGSTVEEIGGSTVEEIEGFKTTEEGKGIGLLNNEDDESELEKEGTAFWENGEENEGFETTEEETAFWKEEVENEEEENEGIAGFEAAEDEKGIGLLKNEEDMEGTVVVVKNGTTFCAKEDAGGRKLDENTEEGNVGAGVTENCGTLFVTTEAEEKVGILLFDCKEDVVETCKELDDEKLEGVIELGIKGLDPNCLELASKGGLNSAKKRTSSSTGLNIKLKPLSDVSLKRFWLKLGSLKGIGFFIGMFKTLSTVWKDGTEGELKLLFCLKADCSKTGGSKSKWDKFKEGFVSMFASKELFVREIWYLLSEESSDRVFWTVVINVDTTWDNRSLDLSSFALEWI